MVDDLMYLQFCLQFVETDMGTKVGSKTIDLMGGYVPMEMVVKGMPLSYYVKAMPCFVS